MNRATLTALVLALTLLPSTGVTATAKIMQNGFITPPQLATLMQRAATGTDLVVMEVGWGPPEKSYDKGHIPGAIHVNTDEIEYDTFPARATAGKDLGRSTTAKEDLAKGLTVDDSLPRNWWNIYPDRYLLPALADMGVDTGSTVILYGEDPSGAARLAWTLLYAGVTDVRLLNGGLAAWQRAGYQLSRQATPRTAKTSFGTDHALHPEYLISLAAVRRGIVEGDTDLVLADIRTRDEYDGKTAPYSYIPQKGRVKNARWGEAGKGPWTMDAYLNDDGTFKSLEQVELMWIQHGINRNAHVAFYCGTGWRASLAFFYAYQMGWPRISNFDGGWYEWSMGPEADRNPVE
ncbi:MAG: sulfurtransferase [Desulfopila sp.]